MSDHEQLHESRERDADRLADDTERLGADIAAARQARERAAADEFIASPEPEEDPDRSGPEADYPSKD